MVDSVSSSIGYVQPEPPPPPPSTTEVTPPPSDQPNDYDEKPDVSPQLEGNVPPPNLAANYSPSNEGKPVNPDRGAFVEQRIGDQNNQRLIAQNARNTPQPTQTPRSPFDAPTTEIRPASSTPTETPGKPSGRATDSRAELTDTVPTTQRNVESLQYVRQSSARIQDAASQYRVSPDAVGAILFEEGRRYDSTDLLQDSHARNHASLYRHHTSYTVGADDSLGRAQMKPSTLDGLIRSGTLQRNANGGALANLPTREQYSRLDDGQKYKVKADLLLDPKAAPYLAAAQTRANLDAYVNAGGDRRALNNVGGPNSSAQTVRDSVQFRVATQLYSTPIPANPPPRYTLDRPVNYRGFDAYHNIDEIRSAMYSKDNNTAIKPFAGWRNGFNN
jgi:hypothetical protein